MLNAELLVAQYIPFVDYSSLRSPWMAARIRSVGRLPYRPMQFPCYIWSSVPSLTHCCIQVLSLHILKITDC